jgi:hypothetical protein
MSANLKGQGGIKGLALRHGEKLIIGVVGLLALWFVYSSLSLPKLEDQYQVDRLKNQISQTNTAITNSTWPEGDDAPGVEDVRKRKPITKQGNVAIDPELFKIDSINPSVMPPSLLRTDPIVLNAEDVRVYGESGLLAWRDQKTIDEQSRRARLLDEERAKKAADAAAKQATENENRRGNQPPEIGAEPFDPEHPTRRQLESSGVPVGAQLQGGERLERAYWATVVAKVPIREQLKLHQDAFQDARGGYEPSRDFPQYVGYMVQRSEIVNGKPQPWKLVYVYDGQRKYIDARKPAGKFVNVDTVTKLTELAASEWATGTMEPVDARWTDAMLTLPLPPLVGRNFGEDATHPDIPLAKDAPPPEDQTQAVAETTAAAAEPEEENDEEITFRGGSGGPATAAASPYAQGGRPSMQGYRGGPREFGAGPGYGPGAGAFVPGMEGGAGMGPGAGMISGGISAGGRTDLPREVDHLLLRFFDFTVEPGKQYQYRVKIAIADPNHTIALESGALDPAVMDRRSKDIQAARAKGGQAPWTRAAKDWSEASRTVGIPTGAGLVHIAEAKLPSGKTANDEPSVKLIAESFDVEPADGSAIHFAPEAEFRRGAVVNMKGKMRYTGDNDRWIDTKDSHELHTGLTVLDIDGADKTVRDMTAPTRVLLMDPAGNITIHNELDDAPDVKYLRVLFDDKPRNPMGMPGGAEFGPEGGRRGGRGGR